MRFDFFRASLSSGVGLAHIFCRSTMLDARISEEWSSRIE